MSKQAGPFADACVDGANEHVASLLDAYLDGEIEPDARRRVVDHLGTCAACRERLAELEALRGLLAADAAADVPLGVPTERFWADLAPTLPARPADLGAGWLWAPPMVLGVLLAHIIPIVAAIVGVLVTVGLPVARLIELLVPGPVAPVAGPVGSWAADAGALVGRAPWLTWLGELPDPLVGIWLPSLLFLCLAAVLALGFLGWALAALRRSAVPAVVSC